MSALAEAARLLVVEERERLDNASRMSRYERDPVAFCREVLGFDPWSKQREVLRSVVEHKRTAVRSGHGIGKTSIAARAAIHFLKTLAGSLVLTTAPTWHQVRDLVWKEIHVAHAKASLRAVPIGGQLTDTRLELGPGWQAIGLSTDKPERFQGHHAEHLLLVVDEASGVDQAIFEAAEGMLTSAGAKVLLIGNPTQPAGEFYDAFHRNRALYSTIAISQLDTPAFTGEAVTSELLARLPSPESVEEARAKWGEDSPIYAIRVLGEFPTGTDDTVVSLYAIEGAQQRRQDVSRGRPNFVVADVARFGSDETVIGERRDWRFRLARQEDGRLCAWTGQDTMRTAGECLRVARRMAAEEKLPVQIVVDDDGVGGGVVDRLREVGEFQVLAFNGGAAPREPREYPNRRSEAWFRLADRMGDIDLDGDEQLAADLVAPRYKIDSKGRRVVEPKADTKKRLGRSPDRGDVAVMAFATDGETAGPDKLRFSEPGDGVIEPSVTFGRPF